MPYETTHAGYLISDDPALLDVAAVHAYLSRSYWAEGIPHAVVARALSHSLCLGIYTDAGAARRQIGLVRVVTDRATFAYLCDVYVLEEHRGLGLAKAALQAFESHPDLQNLRRKHLVTNDAQGLYAQFGFKPVEWPERHMEKRDVDVYRRQNAAGRTPAPQ